MKYLVGIGYVNRYDLLKKAIESIQPFWSNTLIIDNSSKRDLRNKDVFFTDVRVYEPPVPLTFSQTMNLLHRLGAEQQCDVIMFMHNDAEADVGIAEQFLNQIEKLQREGRKWGVAFTNYHTLVAFNMKAVKETGPWDTILPHYFSDNDYYRRLQYLRYEHVNTALSVIHYNNGSSTIKSDAQLEHVNTKTFPLYEWYYQIKWGGLPGRERYIIPFNQYSINPVKEYLKIFENQNSGT